MKFKLTKGHSLFRKRILSTIMRTFIFLLSIALFSFTTKNSFSQEKVTIDADKTVPVDEVFNIIQKQTKYRFIYPQELFLNMPKVKLKKGAIEVSKLLEQTLGSNFNFKLSNDNRIVIKENSVPDNLKNIKQQKHHVSGKITDLSGQPLFGASILEKGTSNGVKTDVAGFFSMDVKNESAILVISFIGFDTEEVKATTGAVQITLTPSFNSLESIVVTGYGTVKKKDVTGSLSSAPIDDMLKAPVANIADALQGRLAGVAVSSPDGQPGSVPNIVIRGNNSISQSSSPLYVIDGFPIEDASLGSLNPSDIESMDVLKDASATAIYGARGANGVVIITTKKGKAGLPVISFGISYGQQKMLKKMDLLSPYDYVVYQKEKDVLSNNLYVNPITGVRGPGTIADSTYLKYATLDSYKNIPGIDLQDQMFVTAPFHNYDLSVSGGNKDTKYAISGNLFDVDGIMINSGYSRKQGRVVLDQNINDKFKVGINANYSNLGTRGGSPSSTSVTNRNSAYAPMFGIWGARPVAPIGASGSVNEDLSNDIYDPQLIVNGSNPLLLNPVINQQHMVRTSSANILAANAYAEYRILPSLTLRVTGGISTNSTKIIAFNDTLTNQGNPRQSANGPNGSIINTASNSWVNENMLTYSKTFNGGHSLTVNGIVSEQVGSTSSDGEAANHLPNASLGVNGLDEGTPVSVTASYSDWALNSFTGRVNYDYKKKYFFTGTYRADGSSRFTPENRWAYFPSGAFKWRFSDEQFLKGNKILSDGSLRISYGLTGNNRLSDYAFLTPVKINLSGAVFNNTIVASASPTTMANPNLKWETTSQVNIGTDLSFFKNRLSFTADVYRKKTYDLLLNAALPPTSGYSTVYKNVGSVQNQGLELSLNGTVLQSKDFTWTANFNISWNQSKVLALAENQDALMTATYFDLQYASSPSYIAKIGQPLGQMYGYVFDGLYQTSDFNYLPGFNPSAVLPGSGSHYILKDNVPTNGTARTGIQPGDIKYKDLNGDGVINATDQTVIGRGLPVGSGGFGNNFKYKNFDLNLFFQFSYGNDIQNANRILFDGNGNGNNQYLNLFSSYTNRWTPTNTNTTNFRIGGQGPVGYYSSRTIEDGSYLRLKTVQLGYSLSDNLSKKIGIKTLKVYVSGQNIFTWTKYSGPDPEISTFNSALTPGFDYSGYPRARTLTMGANILF